MTLREALGLTKAQKDALESCAWGTYWFGSLTSNRQVRRSVLVRLAALGLVKDVGPVCEADGDGFTVCNRDGTERWRPEGWALTDEGLTALGADHYAEKIRKHGRGPR